MLLSVAVTAGVAAAPAVAAEQFVAVDVSGRLVTFSGDGAAMADRGRAPTVGGVRVIGLDRQPGGALLALDADGVLYDVDPSTLRFSPRFDGRRIVPPDGYAIEDPSTFTVSPDGTTALFASAADAHAIDLRTGTVTRVPPLHASAADGGAAANPSVDTLPDGRLAGIDWARPAVATESAHGDGLRALGDPGVDWFGPTRFSLDPAGGTGWVVTRDRLHGSMLLAVNPVTGASSMPISLETGIDAFAAIGPAAGSAPPDPPPGPPLPLSPAAPATTLPTAFATAVTIGLPAQTRRDVLRRHGLLVRFSAAARVRVIAIARLGRRKVCAAQATVGPGRSRRVMTCSARQLALLRTAPRGTAVITFTLRDTRGSITRTRRLALR